MDGTFSKKVAEQIEKFKYLENKRERNKQILNQRLHELETHRKKLKDNSRGYM